MGEGNEQKVSGKKIRSHGAGLAMRVSCVSIAINVVLSVFKVGAGILAHSGAMISDGVHSASDVFSTLIVMAGITMASRKSADGIPLSDAGEKKRRGICEVY